MSTGYPGPSVGSLGFPPNAVGVEVGKGAEEVEEGDTRTEEVEGARSAVEDGRSCEVAIEDAATEVVDGDGTAVVVGDGTGTGGCGVEGSGVTGGSGTGRQMCDRDRDFVILVAVRVLERLLVLGGCCRCTGSICGPLGPPPPGPFKFGGLRRVLVPVPGAFFDLVAGAGPLMQSGGGGGEGTHFGCGVEGSGVTGGSGMGGSGTRRQMCDRDRDFVILEAVRVLERLLVLGGCCRGTGSICGPLGPPPPGPFKFGGLRRVLVPVPGAFFDLVAGAGPLMQSGGGGGGGEGTRFGCRSKTHVWPGGHSICEQ